MQRHKGAPRSSMATVLGSWGPRQKMHPGGAFRSWTNGWQPRARRNPFLICLELDAEPVIEHAEGAIAIAHNSFRHQRLDFLCDHADVRTIAAVVAEAIVAKAVCKMPEENDIVLDHDVGPSPAAATAATATTPTATAEAATTATAEAAATTATYSHAAAAAGAGEACTAARGVALSNSTGPHIAKGVAASARRSLCSLST